MKTKLLVLFFLIATTGLYAQKDPCECNETTEISGQFRTKAKHVTDYNSYPKAKEVISPEDVISWELSYSTYTRDIKEGTDRVHDTPEDSLYTLKGYMYFLKQEANDCDFHIEIGPKNKRSTRRVIVEVSKENCALQQEILSYIKSKGYGKNKQFNKGIPCELTGLGFYDAIHKPKNHGGKFTHKTSWEIHPVKSLKFD